MSPEVSEALVGLSARFGAAAESMATDRAIADGVRREVPVEACAPWCTVGKERHREQHPGERDCESLSTSLPRSLGRPDRQLDGRWIEDWVDVSVREDHGITRVALYLPSDDSEAEFTPDEARAVALQLLAYAEVADPTVP